MKYITDWDYKKTENLNKFFLDCNVNVDKYLHLNKCGQGLKNVLANNEDAKKNEAARLIRLTNNTISYLVSIKKSIEKIFNTYLEITPKMTCWVYSKINSLLAINDKNYLLVKTGYDQSVLDVHLDELKEGQLSELSEQRFFFLDDLSIWIDRQIDYFRTSFNANIVINIE